MLASKRGMLNLLPKENCGRLNAIGIARNTLLLTDGNLIRGICMMATVYSFTL